jgi:ubiquinone/menaquinone biosynthesis C-methylase UbiE
LIASVPAAGASRRFFDLWSRVYDNRIVQALTYRPVQDAVIARVRDRRPTRILDVGCGTGLLTTRLARELAVPVTGIDYSTGMLEAASRRHAGVSWLQANAMALPLRDEVVDTIVCTESFHWYTDQELALREFARLLVPGGRAYVALVGPPADVVARAASAWGRVAGQPFRWRTPEQMRRMANDAGLTVVEQRHVVRIPMTLLLPAVLNVFERPARENARNQTGKTR